jgi:dienelactone hydrolase
MMDATVTGLPDPGQVPIIGLPEADPGAAFRVVGDTAYLFFTPGSDRLIVSFDNLASIDEPYPRLPWLYRHVRELGYSLLGVQSHAKDWFRQDTAPAMIRLLREQDFFTNFSRIVFTGASMGGFGALNFAPLVPGASVLAFSPQTTMQRQIVPFEQRFPWAVRNSNWEAMPFLDAAAAVPYLQHATVLFDPFVPEDKYHAERLAAPHVQMVRLAFATHEAVRTVVRSGAMPTALHEFAETGALGQKFWKEMRERRTQRKWRRILIETAQERHPRLTLRAAEALLREQDYVFARRARDAILGKHPELGPKAGT